MELRKRKKRQHKELKAQTEKEKLRSIETNWWIHSTGCYKRRKFKPYIRKINIQADTNAQVKVELHLSNNTTAQVGLQDFKNMGYAEWRDILILLKEKLRSDARDEVKKFLRVLYVKQTT